MHGDEIDWTKVHEVGLAFLWLGRSGRRVPCRMSQSLLDGFYEDGLIDDPRAALGTVELTKEGEIEAERMLRKHFQRRTSAEDGVKGSLARDGRPEQHHASARRGSQR